MVELRKELEKNSIIMLVLPSDKYLSVLMGEVAELHKNMSKSQSGLCNGVYVTLNNPYSSLLKIFDDYGINGASCFFIDAISSTVKVKTSAENCIFTSSPSALTELSITINSTCQKLKPELLVFDSLSTLQIYLPMNTIVKFSQSLVTKLKDSNIKAIFPIIKNDDFIKNMSMFINKIIELG